MLQRLLTLSLLPFATLIVVTGSNSCLTANNERGLPDYQQMDTDMQLATVPLQHQAIIPSYKFQCCGDITEWTVSIANNGSSVTNTLSLQVWRPSPAVSITGCYSLVGNNNFTSVPLENELTVVRPALHERIHFQPGDVLGFYVENTDAAFSDEGNSKNSGGGVMMLSDLDESGDQGYATEEVWYATNLVFANAHCLAAVGPGRLLDSSTNGAPIISVSYSKYA